METLGLRDPALIRSIADKIKAIAPSHEVKLCHICGTHEYTVTHFGLRTLLPKNVEVIAGPGCPVCVVPAKEIDEAVRLANQGTTVLTFGDMYRVAGSETSLADAKTLGADVRIVYSVSEAVAMARREADKEFVFFAIGFETTAPTNACEIMSGVPENLSFLVSHRLIPPAMELLMGVGDLKIDGFICPGHVATITGTKAFELFPEAYGMPTVIAGFEPADFLLAILMALKQLRTKPKLENEYVRSVTYEGNVRAQRFISRVFDTVDGEWRGIGLLPLSAYKLKDELSTFDARLKYDIKVGPSRDIPPGCSCHLVIIGKIPPTECPLFMKECRPEHPLGPCMVSLEGTCQIWAAHREHRLL
ncbi:MAG: hydrogenase formation protein HypD [Candidatus Bathyarchaeia archaeon]